MWDKERETAKETETGIGERKMKREKEREIKRETGVRER